MSGLRCKAMLTASASEMGWVMKLLVAGGAEPVGDAAADDAQRHSAARKQSVAPAHNNAPCPVTSATPCDFLGFSRGYWLSMGIPSSSIGVVGSQIYEVPPNRTAYFSRRRSNRVQDRFVVV